jgi:hypothetical protein
MMDEIREHIINVVPNAAGQGVREELEIEANGRGLKIRFFVGQIYKYAVNNKEQFNGKIKNPRQKNGGHIGAVTDTNVAKKLEKWADDLHTSRGLLCNYILEMAIEKNLFDKILS